ncbi:MAG: hypothetical protein RLN72_08485, partial [Henriciella sp.]
MLDSHVTACLEKNWPVLGMLVGLVRRLVGAAVFTRANRTRANHLLRMAEAFSRRLLVLRAAALDPVSPLTSRAGPQADKRARGQQPSGRPSLSLAEPLPEFVPLSDTPFPPPAPRLGAGDTDPDAVADPAHATRRLEILLDIL